MHTHVYHLRENNKKGSKSHCRVLKNNTGTYDNRMKPMYHGT